MVPDKTRRIRKFNPGVLQSDDEIIKQFVVRGHEFKPLLTLLQDNIESPSCQHALIIAPRGHGKTMLLTRIAAELRTNEEFSQYLLPVRFIEESQEIFTMADFWLETLYHLAIECKRIDHLLAEELDARHTTLSKKWSSDTLEEHAKIAVLDAADRTGRKLVLMVENLQSLNEAVDKEFGWELRQVLQSEPQIILLGSATSRFTGIDDATQPFFELFRIIKLQPLNTDECLRLWNFLTGNDYSNRQIRPLQILTGGSPRLIVILASLARHMPDCRLMEELVLVIDEYSEYFRANLESLAKTERRVFIAVIDLWQPSTPREISVRTRMDIRTVSTMLGRLVKRGKVKTDGTGRKRKYSASERLHSIYYKLRRNRDEASVVQGLICFMSAFYTDAEQKAMYHELIRELDEFPASRTGFYRALNENPRTINHLPPINLEIQNPVASTIQKTLETRIIEAIENFDFRRVSRIVDRALSSQCSESAQLEEIFFPWALQMKAIAQQKAGDLNSALSTAEEVIKGYGATNNIELQPLIAKALIIQGEVLQTQLDPKLTSPTTNEHNSQFGPVKADSLRWNVPGGIINDHGLPETQYNIESAISAYEAAVDRLDSIENQEFQWHIANALTNKGDVLRDSGHFEHALITFKNIVERFRDTDNLELESFVKYALFRLGEIHFTQGHLERALYFLDEVDNNSSANRNPQLEIWEIWALMIKGRIFGSLNKLGTALTIFEDVVERFSTSEPPELQVMVTNAFIYKAFTLTSLTQAELNDSTHPTPLSVLENGINLINNVDRSRGATEMLLPLQKNRLLMLILKGLELYNLNRIGEALEAFDKVIEHSSLLENLELQNLSVQALICKAELQIGEGKIDDASNTHNELVRRLSELDLNEQDGSTWDILQLKTQILFHRGDIMAATNSFQSLYTAFEYKNEEHIRVISNFAIKLVVGGMSSSSVLKILSGNDAYEDALYPLITALRLEAGGEVRVPEEVREIASDIRADIQRFKGELTLHQQ